VISDKGHPSLGWIRAPATAIGILQQIFLDGSWRDGKSKLDEKFICYASLSPVGLSRAMDKISPRRSLGIPGLPSRRDFQRHNNLKPFRCQPTRVSGRTVIKASLQSNSFATKLIVSRVASVAR
jgi:hypothetical protein